MSVDAVRLVWVDSFLAAAALGSYKEAAYETGRNGTTIRRQVERLEVWLHRVLVTDDVPFVLTDDAFDFVPHASEVMRLVDIADLRGSLSKARVEAAGYVTIEGAKLNIPETAKIASIMIGSRARLNPLYYHRKTSAGDIVMDRIFKAAPSAARTEDENLRGDLGA